MSIPKQQREPSRTPALLTFVILIAILYVGREVLIPIALAALLTFLLAPVVRVFERARLPRLAAVLLVVTVTVASIGIFVWAFEHQVEDLAAKLPEYKTNIITKFDTIRASPHSVLGKAETAIAELGHELSKPAEGAETPLGRQGVEAAPPVPVRVVEAPAAPLTYTMVMLRPLIGPLTTAGIVIIFLVFMLWRREDLRNRFIRLIGERDMHLTTEAFDDAAQRVSKFLLMQVVVNGGVGLLIGVGLFFIGLPNPWLWGLFAALMRFVPYVGIWMAAAVPVVISLAISPGFVQPALTLGLFIVIEAIAGNLLEPMIIGSGTGVAPLALLIAAVFWTWLWGGVGLLLSTPITVCMVVVGQHVPRLRFLTILLRDEPALPPETQLYQRLLAEDPEEAERIVERFAKDKPAVEIYDALILPALKMAETHRHKGDLDEAREDSIWDALETTIEDIGERPAAAPEAPPAITTGHVLCIPARDRADELAARMLSQLLVSSGIESSTLSAQAFIGELLTAVTERAPSAVCISAVPPAAAAHVRVLVKKLRTRFPELPIVVGVWDAKADVQTVRQRLGTNVTDHVAVTLAQAVEIIRPLAVKAD